MTDGVWILGYSKRKQLLYTSDNPISIIVDYEQNPGVFEHVIHVSYPLLPNLSLFLVSPITAKRLNYKQYQNQLLPLETFAVDYFNKLQVFSAHRHVFSSKDNFEAAQKFQESQIDLSDKEMIKQFYSLKN